MPEGAPGQFICATKDGFVGRGMQKCRLSEIPWTNEA